MKITIELNLLTEIITLASSAVLQVEGIVQFENPDQVAIALSKRVLDAEMEIACISDLFQERRLAGERLLLEGCGIKDI